MKTLHYINLAALLITIGLYASIKFVMYGMIASFFLGIIQLFLGIILIVYYQNFSTIHQNYLKTYWAIVILDITAIIIISDFSVNHFYSMIIVQIIPMLIATYFVFLTYQVQKL
ncbi:hypothetical protein [Aureibaculum conchae]|uniref:hypothetical protein n=1 Tax=Aureibaculum sp. 2308TA14-22 TaxID=3108392 RepID=UPI0033960A88